MHILKTSNETFTTRKFQCAFCIILHTVTLGLLWCLSVHEDHYPEVFERAMPFAGTGGSGRNQIWQALFCFEIGVIVAHLECIIERAKVERSAIFKVSTIIICICGFLALEMLTMSTAARKGTSSMWSLRHQDFACFQATALLVWAVLCDGVCDCCCSGLLAVQKLHFSVYLIHGTVIYALGSRAYIAARFYEWSSPHAYFITVAACLPPLYLLAYIVHHYMEIPFGEKFPRWVEKQMLELPSKVGKYRGQEIPMSKQASPR